MNIQDMRDEIEVLSQTAVKIMLETGEHAPQVMAMGPETAQIVVFDDLPDSHYAKGFKLFMAGKIVADQIGPAKVDRVYMMIEAWAVTEPIDERDLTVAPSEHPDRVEVLIITGLTVDQQVCLVKVYEVLRTPDGEFSDLLDMLIEPSAKAHSHLLEAFVGGYVSGPPPNIKFNGPDFDLFVTKETDDEDPES